MYYVMRVLTLDGRLSDPKRLLRSRPVSRGRSARLQMEGHDARGHGAPLGAPDRVFVGRATRRPKGRSGSRRLSGSTRRGHVAVVRRRSACVVTCGDPWFYRSGNFGPARNSKTSRGSRCRSGAPTTAAKCRGSKPRPATCRGR